MSKKSKTPVAAAKIVAAPVQTRREAALDKLRAAHAEALEASGIDLSTRSIIKQVLALATGSGVYYVAVQATMALSTAAFVLTSSMLIEFMVMLLGVVIAALAGWYMYQFTRIAIDKLTAVDYPATFGAIKSNVVGIFSRTPKVA